MFLKIFIFTFMFLKIFIFMILIFRNSDLRTFLEPEYEII